MFFLLLRLNSPFIGSDTVEFLLLGYWDLLGQVVCMKNLWSWFINISITRGSMFAYLVWLWFIWWSRVTNEHEPGKLLRTTKGKSGKIKLSFILDIVKNFANPMRSSQGLLSLEHFFVRTCCLSNFWKDFGTLSLIHHPFLKVKVCIWNTVIGKSFWVYCQTTTVCVPQGFQIPWLLLLLLNKVIGVLLGL